MRLRTCGLHFDHNSLLELGVARSEINTAEVEQDVLSPWWRPKTCCIYFPFGLAC